MSGVKYYLGLCAIAKNETPYLREWTAYHRLIGFERIFIYDNESDIPVDETLRDFDDADLVETYRIEGKGRQLTAYNHCLQKHGPECEWLAFFDLDEFLLLHGDKDARIFLSRYEEHAALALSVMLFGSNGQLGHAPGLVTERFTRSIGYCLDVKCIVRPALVTLPISPHHFTYAECGTAVATNGLPAFGGYAPFTPGAAQINHYYVKSQQEYEKRLERGDAVYTQNNPRSLALFYQQAARTGREESGILRHAPGIRRMMKSGTGRHIEADSPLLLAEPYPLSLERLNAALQNGDTGLAHLVFCLSRRRFGDKAFFWRLGVKACLAQEDYEGALQAARHLVELAQVPESYEALFEAQSAAGLQEEARRNAVFLSRVAEAGSPQREKARQWLLENGLDPAVAHLWPEE